MENNKKIKTIWFLGGLLLFAYAAYVKITGKFIIHEEYTSLLVHRDADAIGYYFNLIFSAVVGAGTLYRSLLFIPSNQKFHDEYPEHQKKMAELRKADLKVNPARLFKIILVIVIIFFLIMLLRPLLQN